MVRLSHLLLFSLHGLRLYSAQPILNERPQSVSVSHESVWTRPDFKFREIQILPDATAAFVGAERMIVQKRLVNYGTWYQNAPSKYRPHDYAQTVITADYDIINFGSFLYDQRGAHTAPRIKMGKTRAFVNSGEMLFVVGGQERNEAIGLGQSRFTASADVAIASSDIFRNDGYMFFSGSPNYLALVDLSMESASGRPVALENNGLICLKYSVWKAKLNFVGNGCVAITSSAVMALRDDMKISSGQRFFMDPQQTAATLDIFVSGRAKLFFIHVFGMGQLCQISFTRRMIFRGFSNSGVMNFSIGNNPISHKVSLGSHFRAEDLSFDGITIRTTRPVQRFILEDCICRNENPGIQQR